MNTHDKQPTVAFVFARGGSKGIPRKNLRELGGLPMIAWSIEVARNCHDIDRVVVSTDDEEIADVARQYGADVPFIRPASLAEDGSSELDAWKHAITALESVESGSVGTFVSLPPTSPMRSEEDVRHCLQTYRDGDFDIVLSLKEASRSPYFNMVRTNTSGAYELVCQPGAGATVWRRQDAPTVYDITTVAYVADPAYVLATGQLLAGRVGGALIPEERAIDIDTHHDLRIAQLLMDEGRDSEKLA